MPASVALVRRAPWDTGTNRLHRNSGASSLRHLYTCLVIDFSRLVASVSIYMEPFM